METYDVCLGTKTGVKQVTVPSKTWERKILKNLTVFKIGEEQDQKPSEETQQHD